MSEILRIPVNSELGDRVRWLIKGRWFVIPLAAAAGLGADHLLGNVFPQKPILLTCLAVALYNALFWVLTHRLTSTATSHQAHAIIMHTQIIADLLALSILLHLTGGIENPFSAYYALLVVVGSVLMTRRSAYLYAAVASVLWCAVVLLEATELIPHYNLRDFRSPIRYQQGSHIIAEAFVVVTASFVAAHLVSHIAERLRQGEEQLYDANLSCQLRAAELVDLNEQLRDLDRTRSLFIRLVTHELRAPVAAIQSYLQLILEGYVPQERLQEIIAKAERRARDQLELIGDLLDLARTQTSTRERENETADAAAILRDVVDMMQARVTEKGLTLEMSIAPDLPPVQAAPEHIKQVWMNLVSNAIKYTPDGGRVSIHLTSGEGLICGVVRDTGIGIAPEDQERIFENFVRTEAAKAMTRHGTGLGLSIVASIIKRYGGSIWLDSSVGQGSTFSFEIPAA